MYSAFSGKAFRQEFWSQDLAEHIDRVSSECNHDSGESLMEKAGWWVAIATQSLIKLNENIIILVGNGNNGGDALVAARLLIEAGFSPTIVELDQCETNHSALRRLQQRKLKPSTHLVKYTPGMFARQKAHHLIIDGLLGLGLKGPIRDGLAKTCLEEVAQISFKRVLAIDIPSGLQVDYWEQPKAILPADFTITFGAPKPVHIAAPSRFDCGDINCYPLDFAKAPDNLQAKGMYITSEHMPWMKIWDQIPSSVHKYTRSHVLVVGGSPGRYGAPILSALAASKAGAGIVSVALPHKLNDTLGRIPLELVAEDLFEDGHIQANALKAFIALRKPSAIVIGPGCMKSPLNADIMAILQDASFTKGIFIVIDAGAIDSLELLLSQFPMDPRRCLITPHPGEWMRFGQSAIGLSSLSALKKLQHNLFDQWGTSILYKTATPISIFPKDAKFFAGINTSGDISLSKAGTGDVLSGISATVGSRMIPAWESGLIAYSWLSAAAKHACSLSSINGVSSVDILNAVAAISS